MIFTFDARGFLLYPLMKAAFGLGDEDVYQAVQYGFETLQKQLAGKNISYAALKGALIPNQDRDKFETCFVIDTNQMNSANYGYDVFERLLPLLDKASTYSILCGDYVDILDGQHSDSQGLLRSAMGDVLARCHESRYVHSSQYYLIYINRLSGSQRLKIVEGLYPYPWFTGFADVTYGSPFKSYLSGILASVCIKNKNKVIVPHPLGHGDEENINVCGYPFEENGFLLSSINDDSYGAFLSYKIESEVPDRDDVGFSFNALFPKFDSLEKLTLTVSDSRWDQYLTDREKGKGDLAALLGYDLGDRERFIREIFKQICANYIYNLTENQYGNLKFNVCAALPTIHGTLRKTTIALKYDPETGLIEVLTIT